MPYLIVQLGVVAAWIATIAIFIGLFGRKGLWILVSAPVVVLGWGAAKVLVVLVGALVTAVIYRMAP